MGCACIKSDVVVKNQKAKHQYDDQNKREVNKSENKQSVIKLESINKGSNNRNAQYIERHASSLNKEIIIRSDINNIHNINNIINEEYNPNSNRNNNQYLVSNIQNRSSNNIINNNNLRGSINNDQLVEQHSSNLNYIPSNNNRDNISNIIPGVIPYLPSNNDPNFNFPEVGDVMVGTGLKKMKGYISSISPKDLEKKRAEYWGNQNFYNYFITIF